MDGSLWRAPLALALLALAGATGAAAEGGAPRPRAGATDTVDAEMLRDLDLLSSPDYGREREVARRLGLVERMRLLDYQRAQEAASAPPDGDGPPPPPPPSSRPAPVGAPR